MKKPIIILSIFAVIVNSCNQATRTINTENTENTSIVVNDTILVEVQNVKDKPFEIIPAKILADSIETERLRVKRMDSATYFFLKEKVNPQKTELEVIKDFNQVKEILKGLITWTEHVQQIRFRREDPFRDDTIYHFTKIVCRNGKIFSFDDPMYRPAFTAYFPQEDVLLGEAGHSSDWSINLTTGQQTESVGNPWINIYSPSKRYRLIGYYGGQTEGAFYTIQKKINGQYQPFPGLAHAFRELVDFDMRFILDYFWEDDTTLYIITSEYDGGRFEKLYYQIVLKEQ